MKTSNKILAIGLCLALGSLVAACGAELTPGTQKNLSSALEAKKGEFKACYEEALTKDREARGDMSLVLDIKADAKKPHKVTVPKSAIGDGQMKGCVKKAAGGIQLDKTPAVPVEGQYTLNFGFEG